MSEVVILKRRETFSASHRLHSKDLSDEENRKIFGKCNSSNGHGHNYVLEVSVRGRIDARTGMVMNLSDLKAAIQSAVLARIDHKHLNLDVPDLRDLNPTTEILVVQFWKWLLAAIPNGLLYEITLHETENNIAIYRGESY